MRGGENSLNRDGKRIKVEIGQVRDAQDVAQRIKKPERPEDAIPPDIPDIDMSQNMENVNTGIEIGMARVDSSLNIVSGGGFSTSDGDYLPIVKVNPIYPRRAQERGLEGYVILEFTVTNVGSVTDVVVVETTSSIFNRAAIKAASKFKYKPRVVDGEPVAVSGILHKITFEMEK